MGNDQSTQKPGFYTPAVFPNGTDNASFPDLLPTAKSGKTTLLVPIPTGNTLDQMLDEIDNDINQNNTLNNSVNKSIYQQIKTDNMYLNVSFIPKQNHIHTITDVFTYHKQLGSGASGRVLLVSDNKTNVKYALKEMNRNKKLNKLLFVNEYNILKRIKHKNIISYIDSWSDQNCYYLATNYCSGGTMLDRIISQSHFSERECADFIKDVLMAVKYLHSNNIVHRDIKCSNLVFDKKGNDGILKIIDFGNSELIKNKNQIDTLFVGSLHYLSPEMISRNDKTKGEAFKGDMWAIGVVCYVLVAGRLPFYGHNQSIVLQKIKNGLFSWPKNIILSDACKNFVSGLLTKDINQRFDAQQALNHEWIINKATDNWFGDTYLSSIQAFHQANKLQRILVNAVLSEMDKNDKQILLKAIRDLDINGNQQINENDIINYILVNGSVHKPTKTVKHRAKTVISQIRNCLKQMSNVDLQKLPIAQTKLQKRISLNDNDVEDILQELINDDVLTDDNHDIDDQKSMTLNMVDQTSNTSTNNDDNAIINAQKQDVLQFSASNSKLLPDSLRIDCSSNIQPNSPDMSHTISVEKFSSLIVKSATSYDLNNLLAQLNPANGDHILLSKISDFDLPLISASNTIDQSVTTNVGSDLVNDDLLMLTK